MANQYGIMATKKTNDIKQVDDKTFMVGDGAALVLFAESQKRHRETISGKVLVGNSKKEEGIAFWGNKNTLPEEREILISNNNIVPQLIATKRNIILGTGNIIAYKERFEKGKIIKDRVEVPSDIEDFIEGNNIENEYLPVQTKNLLIHGNFFTEGNRGQMKKSTHIVSLKARDSKYTRSGLQSNKGIVSNYYISNTWTNHQQNPQANQRIATIPAYNKKANQAKFMLHGADKLLGGPYYYIPHWEGAWTWIQVANCIPAFHYSNIENGYSIRYIIKVPDDYFKRMLSDKKRKSEKAAEFEAVKRREFLSDLNKFFKGAKNAGKALVTKKYIYQNIQKQFQGIEIEPLKVDLKDEAMLKLFETTNSANTSSHGTPPALAGIATGAKMTSGSEIKNLFNYYQVVAALHPRKLLFEPINMAVKSFHKDKKIKLGLEDVVLTSTDENITGKKIQNPE